MADFKWRVNALKKEYPKLSDKTLTNYAKNYARFFQNGVEIGEAHKQFFLDKPVSTRLNYIWSVMRAHKVFGDGELPSWVDEMEKSSKEELKVYYNEQKKSKKEGENWISLKELQKYNKSQRTALSAITNKFTNMEMGTQKRALMRDWLITSLYVLDPVNHPPMRVDYNMKIVNWFKGYDEDQETGNYLKITNKSTKHFVFNDYKTSGAYGTKKIKLSKKMNAMMNIYLKYHPDNKYLFGKDENISKNALQKKVIGAFAGTGKTLGVSMLRHIVISDTVDTGDKLKEKAELAEKMGHSVTSQEIYKKFDE